MDTVRHVVLDSPVGPLTVEIAADGAITGLYFDGRAEVDSDLPNPAGPLSSAAEATAREAERQLSDYFHGLREQFDLPVRLQGGTEFQRSVWEMLRAIPYGTTRSYGDLAKAMGKPGASRAVGLACGRNPVSIVIPCHRVVGGNGALTGFGGGLERKRFLLELECDQGELGLD